MNTPNTSFDVPHQRLREQIGAYVDGELSSSEVAILEKHLLTCTPCQNELTLQESIQKRLQNHSLERASAGLRARIERQCEASSNIRHVPSTWGWKRLASQSGAWGGWLVAACLVVALLLNVHSQSISRTHSIPMVASVFADYQNRMAGGELPADNPPAWNRLRHSVSFPVEPIPSLKNQLVAVWSTKIRGEPAAALAYRLDNQIIVQYVVSQKLFFRQNRVRQAIHDFGRYSASLGHDSVVAWPGKNQGSVLIGAMPPDRLLAASLSM